SASQEGTVIRGYGPVAIHVFIAETTQSFSILRRGIGHFLLAVKVADYIVSKERGNRPSHLVSDGVDAPISRASDRVDARSEEGDLLGKEGDVEGKLKTQVFRKISAGNNLEIHTLVFHF